MATLRIIIKADQGGPAEALADALAQLSTSEVRVDVVHRGVGAITESDVLLAKASGAIVLGFHVRPDSNARAAAEREQVDVRTYRIIYEAVEDVRNALEGLLKPEERETVLGEAEVLQLFKVSKVGTIAGCTVRSGTIQRTAKARVIRDGDAGLHRQRCPASSDSRTTCVKCARVSSAASGSRTSTTSRWATGSSRSGWKRSSGRWRAAGQRGERVGCRRSKVEVRDFDTRRRLQTMIVAVTPGTSTFPAATH